MAPLPPSRFSTTMFSGYMSSFWMMSTMVRAMMSLPPPGPNAMVHSMSCDG